VGGLSSLNRVVILIELEAPVLFDMSETVLQGLQQLVQLSKFAVWVTNSGTIYGKIPEKSLVMGFVRSATIEEPSFRVCTIDLDPETLDMSLERAATLVCNAEIGFSSSPDTTSDYNFVEKDGILHISRNIIDEDENRAFRLLNAQETKLESCPSQSSAQMHRIGDPRTIYWDSKASLPILNKYEVMIDLSKASLDVYVLGMLNGLKGYPPNTIECQGTVRAVGSAVTRCEPGDQIICFGPEWFETTFVVHQTDCLVVRKETASDDAAGNSAVTPEPSRLMDNADTRSHAEGPYASSDDIARWRGSMSITGENGLLNWAQRWLFARKNHSLQNNDPPVSAQSGVSRGLHDLFGQYKYFCLAQHILNEIHAPPNGGSVLVDLPGEMLGYALAQRLSTYRVSVTASYASEQEREVLSSILHVSTLDESASWSYARFDVVLTNRVSSLSEGHLDAVRRGGGVVAISTTGQSGLRLASSLLSCGLTVQCVDVLKILEKGHHKLSRSVIFQPNVPYRLTATRHLSTVAALLRNGEIQPAPSHEFPLSDFDSAARAVNDKQRYVGVVLATGRDVLVPVRQRPPPVSFKPDASYILVGCLGGLGRVIT
jgi:NADPH:quinone reductase-like Zn-dependent oxidoreductase